MASPGDIAPEDEVMPMERVPARPLPTLATSDAAALVSERMLRARLYRTRPASVRDTPRASRVTRRTPSSRSSCESS